MSLHGSLVDGRVNVYRWNVPTLDWVAWDGSVSGSSGGDVGAGTSVQTVVNDSASSVTILAANTSRLGATVANDSTAVLYLRLSASAATTTNYTVQLVPGAYFEVPFHYTGAITGIWATDPGTGAARVSEFTA